jgi:hypothetical protein
MTEADRIEQHLATVEARLTAASGDSSLCDLSRTGPSHAVKSLEGAMSALLEARRRLRDADDAAATVVRTVLEEWRAELEIDERRGPIWQSYRTGGIEELEALLHDLRP